MEGSSACRLHFLSGLCRLQNLVLLEGSGSTDVVAVADVEVFCWPMGLYVLEMCLVRKGVMVFPAALPVEEIAISSSSSLSSLDTSSPATAPPCPVSEVGLGSMIEDRLRRRVELRREVEGVVLVVEGAECVEWEVEVIEEVRWWRASWLISRNSGAMMK